MREREVTAIAAALREAARRLEATSETPRLDAELLMAHALEVSRSQLLLRHGGDPVPAGFAALIERRERAEPVAYIVGRQGFFGLEFAVGPAVLIPRPDSETLVAAALVPGGETGRVLDCGTGSGALLLAVLAHRPGWSGIGVDRSAAALVFARHNARRLGLDARARMQESDWTTPGWADALGCFELIVANPPYVETAAALAPSVRCFEPAGALFAGPEGLDAYRSLLPQLPGLLAPGGAILVEIGAGQATAVAALAAAAGLAARAHPDLAGRARVLELSPIP